MTGREWISPRYRKALAAYEWASGRPVVMGLCASCHGSGRVIYQDPQSGQMRDMACLACQGSGQGQ